MKHSEDRAVRSWPSQLELLTWRLEDLDGRLQELSEHLPESPMSQNYDRLFYSQMSNQELDYTIPHDLETIEDVLTAIERTKDKLWCLQCDTLAAERAEADMRAEVVSGQTIIIGFAPELSDLQRLAS